MAKIVCLMLAAVAAVAAVAGAYHLDGERLFLGGITVQPPSKYPEAMELLKAALAAMHSDSTAEKIISYKTQVVAGQKIIIEYADKAKNRCTASWVEQPWISKEPQYFEQKCM